MFFFSFRPGTGPKKSDQKDKCGLAAHQPPHFTEEKGDFYVMMACGFARRIASLFGMRALAKCINGLYGGSGESGSGQAISLQ